MKLDKNTIIIIVVISVFVLAGVITAIVLATSGSSSESSTTIVTNSDTNTNIITVTDEESSNNRDGDNNREEDSSVIDSDTSDSGNRDNSESESESDLEEETEEQIDLLADTEEGSISTSTIPPKEELMVQMNYNPETMCAASSSSKCCSFQYVEGVAGGSTCMSSVTEDECTGEDDIWCPAPTVLYSDFSECDELYTIDVKWGGSYIGSPLTDSVSVIYDTNYNDSEEFTGYQVLMGVSNTGMKNMMKCVLVNYNLDGTWEQVPGSAKYFQDSGKDVTTYSNNKIKTKYNSSTHSIDDDKYTIEQLTLGCHDGLEYPYPALDTSSTEES